MSRSLTLTPIGTWCAGVYISLPRLTSDSQRSRFANAGRAAVLGGPGAPPLCSQDRGTPQNRESRICGILTGSCCTVRGRRPRRLGGRQLRPCTVRPAVPYQALLRFGSAQFRLVVFHSAGQARLLLNSSEYQHKLAATLGARAVRRLQHVPLDLAIRGKYTAQGTRIRV